MSEVKSVCVFCGASNDVEPAYLEESYKLGQAIANNGLHLVFGAGDCGTMGALANGCLEAGGTVTGVFPRILDGLEKEHESLTETVIVDDMHTRKMMMFERADSFIITPGGFGTMDETFEVITWKQLYTHNKPIVFHNFEGYWDKWIDLTEQFISKSFASERTRNLYAVVNTIDDAIAKVKEG